MKKIATVGVYIIAMAAGSGFASYQPNLLDMQQNETLQNLSEDDKDYYKVEKTEIKETQLVESDWLAVEKARNQQSKNLQVSSRAESFLEKNEDDKEGSIDISTIENLGALAADFVRFVEDRAPVAEATSHTANGLPSGAESADILANLSDLRIKKYEYKATNVVGIPLYTAEFLVAHRHGGTYEGKGSFLANVTIVPVSAWAPFLFNVHIDAGNVQVNNVGSKESPVAGLTLEVRILGKGLLSSTVQKVFFEFRGDSDQHKMFH